MTQPGAGDIAEVRRALLDLNLKQRLGEKAAQNRIVAIPRTGKLAVADQQRYLWFLHQLAPQLPVYNVPFALRLRGALDTVALAEALRGLVARHESLRTRFGDDHGVPYQIIDPAPQTWPVPVHTGDEGSMREWIDLGAAEPFDLASGPPFRTRLLRLGPADYVLLLVWHHIVTDGWSAQRISEELTVLYAAARQQSTPDLHPIALQPADYAAWQRNWLLGDEPAEHLEYWRSSLEGVETLEMPTDRPRPTVGSGGGRIYETAFPGELCVAVRDLAKREGVSLLALLMTAYQVVLARHTGQEDFPLGTVLSGRTRSETATMVGFFANSVVIRAALAGNPVFRDLARQCHENLVEAMAHQDITFGALVEALKPERLPGRNPLFQSLFTLMPAGMVAQWRFDGLQVESYTAQPGTSRFDMSFQVTDEPEGGLAIWVEYSTDLFQADRVERLAQQFFTTLAEIVARPGARIETIDTLPDVEYLQVLTDWNPPPGKVDPRLLHELFTAQAGATPHQVAMRFEGSDLSYADLDAQSNQLAHVLIEDFQVKPGAVVAILLERGFGLPVAELGAIKAGGAWLALDPQYPADRLAYQLSDAKATVVVTTAEFADRIPPGTARILLDAGALAGRSRSCPKIDVRAEDPAYVIYTSGSTGTPKGVLVPHRAVVNFCLTFREMFSVTPADRILQFTNPAFDVSVSDFHSTFTAGATVIGAPRSVLLDPEALQSLMATEGVTLVDIPPAVLGMLDPRPLSDLRVLFIGMEPFSAELVNRWSRPGREFHNGYGPTEVTVTCVDYLCPDEPLAGSPPIGRAMANQFAYVLDHRLRPQPIGVAGELYMGGAGLAHGYLGRPDLTAEKFLPNPFAIKPGERMYATGDLVRWRADGNLEFLGRVDRQVKLRGLRVELGEVEHVLAAYPGVRQTAVTVKHPGTSQARLVGYLVPEPGQEIDEAAARNHAATHLPLHMVPAALMVIDELPLTASGKLDTDRLPDPELRALAAAALTTPTQRQLAEVWQRLLSLEPGQIGALDSFFALGGTSLQVTQLISRIRDAFQVVLEPRQLFSCPVLSDLAELIDARQRDLVGVAEVARIEAEIAELSEEELDRLLREAD